VSKLKKNNVEKYLRHFAETIIKRGKQILNAKGKAGKLSESLKYRLEATSKGYNLIFKGADYATFVDKGVSGTKTTRTFHNVFGKRERSPFKYTTKQPPASVLDKWIVKKGFGEIRDKKGRFISRKSLQFLLARSIKSKGLASSSFFSKPMSVELARIDTELLGSFKADILTHFETIEL
tara:strand:- start:1970 stop:2506 length:537 start_codon:yes stop_codon:yes gene_type:complete